MKVTCRYFAALRERRGTATEALDFPVGTTAAQAFATVFPDLPLRVAFAVDEHMVTGDAVLTEGVEVAFLPPVGGG